MDPSYDPLLYPHQQQSPQQPPRRKPVPPNYSPSSSPAPSNSSSTTLAYSPLNPPPAGLSPSTHNDTSSLPSRANCNDGDGLLKHKKSPLYKQHTFNRPDRGSNVLHRDGWFYLAISLVATLSPIIFFVLIGFTVRLEGQKESEWGEKIERVILLVPSIYPVIFAALLSRDLRTYALDLAQSGTSVGTLHQLLSSTTVGGVVKTVWDVQRLNVTLFFLLVIWTFSPLGGQAALRMLSTKSVDLPLPNAEIWYRSADDGTFFHATSFYDDGFTMLSEIYAANFLAPPPLRKMPLDVFGNLRVPMIERLDQAAADEEGWIPTPLDRTSSDGLQQPVPFASLVGIPFQGVPNRGNSTFNIQTNYAYLSCQQPQKVKSLPPHLDAIFQDRSKNGISGNFVVGEPKLPTLSINLTDAGWASGRWQNRSQSVGNRQIGFASVVKEEYRHNVKVGNKTTTVQDITWANTTCTSTQTYVEARVFCRDANCGVIAVRRSTLDHEPEHLSQLDGLGYKNQYFHQYFSQVTDTAAQRNKVRITVTQNYIADPNNFRVLDAMAKKPDVFNITSEEFSTRFTTTYNSFYTAFAALANLLGTNLNLSTVTTPPPDTPARISTELFPALAPVPWKYRPGVLAGGNSTGSPFFAHKSIAEVTESEVRYSVNRVWVGIFTVSVAILLCVSLVGWGLQWRRIAPDFLGTVAGGLRDSEYIKLDDGEEENGGSSVLDGIQAARRWSGKRVLIADVKPEEEVGRVALVGCEEAEREGWGKVKLGRFYE